MHYPYHFVALNDDQTARRRHLLDGYAQFAQLSILLVPLIFYLSRGIQLLLSKLSRQHGLQGAKEHGSPVVAKFNRPAASSSRNVLARLRWALEDEVVEGWGTRQEWLVAGMWAMWLLLLAVKDTGDEYLHLTKRFGIIAASQLPLHYALALKSWSPIQYLTRLSHEELNPYHRLLGRIILTFFSLHASLYLNFYIQKGLLAKRIRDSDVILGLLAISTALLLGTTALSKIRTWNYRVFFYTHVILSISLLPTLYLHVSHLRIYILEASIIYALLIIQRNISQSPAAATITLLPDTNLISITIPLNNNKFLSSRAYKPGQHIYLGFPSLPQKLRINPFSIANPSPLKDRKIRLVARTLAGTTAILADLADHGKTPQQTVPLLIEGPYGSAAHFPNLALNFDRVLLVAGGVGATFALPLFIDLMRHRAEGITTARQGVPSVKFVWTVRGAEDARWGIELVREQMGEVYSLAKAAMEVYVTGSTNKVQTPRAEDADGSIELQERDPLMHGFDENPNTTPTPQNPPPTTLPPKPSRPDFHTLIDQTFSTAAGEKVAVLVCGPKSMGRDLRREVRRWVSEGRDVFWHGEEFAW